MGGNRFQMGGWAPLAPPLVTALCTYLKGILNHCVENGIFPYKLKLAKVIPVFKSVLKSPCTNVKPLLNTF